MKMYLRTKHTTMFGNMMGDLQAKQEALREKLKTVTVSATAGDGAVTVTANAVREITNVAIDAAKLDLSDPEELEDLFLVAVNKALEQAAEVEAAESAALMQSMLPPGLGDMGGLFG